MKHCNSHGDSYAYVEVEFVGPGSTLTPPPSLPQVSTYRLTCTMDFFSQKSMGRGLYMDARKAGGGKDNVRWHNICLYFGLFWAPWKGGYQSILLREILWVCEHKWGLFSSPPPNLAVSGSMAPQELQGNSGTAACLWRVSWWQQAGHYPHIETWSTLLLLPIISRSNPTNHLEFLKAHENIYVWAQVTVSLKFWEIAGEDFEEGAERTCTKKGLTIWKFQYQCIKWTLRHQKERRPWLRSACTSFPPSCSLFLLPQLPFCSIFAA